MVAEEFERGRGFLMENRKKRVIFENMILLSLSQETTCFLKFPQTPNKAALPETIRVIIDYILDRI